MMTAVQHSEKWAGGGWEWAGQRKPTETLLRIGFQKNGLKKTREKRANKQTNNKSKVKRHKKCVGKT